MLSHLLSTILLYSPQAHTPISNFVYAETNSVTNISNSISISARKYGLQRSLLSCILKKESNYRNGVISKTKDYGIAQINIKTAKKYKLDLYALTTSATYAIDKAALILSDYERTNRDESRTWFCRYNIGYQSLSKPGIGAACERYLSKINGCLKSEVYL